MRDIGHWPAFRDQRTGRQLTGDTVRTVIHREADRLKKQVRIEDKYVPGPRGLRMRYLRLKSA
jgi:hypothetical protein